jgi:AcrR family transcriptional regulator
VSTHPRRPIRPQRRTHPDEAPASTVPLTRERLLETALAMIDADGVDALSMRRLGHAVDRDPMRLYRYAESKSALLDAITELVLADFVVPTAVDGDWEPALREAAFNYRRIALAHPKVVPLLVTRPLSTPLGLRPPTTLRSLESLLDLFVSAGFDDRGALHAYRLFSGFLNGHVLNEVQELVEQPEESDALLRFGLHHLHRKEFPRMRALAPTLAGYDGTVELEMGLDIIIAGLRSQLSADIENPGNARRSTR